MAKRTARALALACLGLLALGAAGAGAQQGQQQGQQAAPKPAQIDRNGVLILIRSTLLALHQANETGNYTVLRDLAAPGFREANNAARLAEIFASQRNSKLDLSGVSVLDPQLTLLPQIESNGLLHMAGFFPSVPSQVNFELLFAPVEGRWRPFGIAVNLGSSAPAAPMPPAAQQPQAAPKAEAKGEGKPGEAKKPDSKPAPRPAPKPKPAPAGEGAADNP